MVWGVRTLKISEWKLTGPSWRQYLGFRECYLTSSFPSSWIATSGTTKLSHCCTKLNHYAFREGLVDRLVADLLFTKVQEDGQVPSRWASGPSSQVDLSELTGPSKWGNQKIFALKAQIHLIPAKRGLEIGFAATALFAAELSLQNASSAIRIYALISERKIILPVWNFFIRQRTCRTSSTIAEEEN